MGISKPIFLGIFGAGVSRMMMDCGLKKQGGCSTGACQGSPPNILLMIESSRESGRKLISGIADYAHHAGPWQFHWEPADLKDLPGRIKKGAFDGALVRDLADVTELRNAKIPCVVFSYERKQEGDIVFINADDAAIAKLVADDFLRRGFRNFAFCGPRSAPWALERGRRFEAVLSAAGMNVCMFHGDFLSGSGSARERITAELTCWLQELPKPVALMAANDDAARQVVQICKQAGLRVPDDCSIVGVDNDPVVCGLSDPPLSSVSLNQHKAGYLAAAALDRMMHGETLASHQITAPVDGFVVRQSSDIFAVEHPVLVKALRFIQKNGARRISVDEVARAAGANRRTLERYFHEYFNESIHSRCREMRAEHVENLIRATHLSLEQIAEQCGFAEPCHMTRFYASVRNETPSSYRKRILRF
jgi:LacI family transcriptional regulator